MGSNPGHQVEVAVPVEFVIFVTSSDGLSLTCIGMLYSTKESGSNEDFTESHLLIRCGLEQKQKGNNAAIYRN